MPFFKYDDKQIYYNQKGHGKPVLLLHGNTASSNMFHDVIALYSKTFHVITIDFLGHGKSDRIPHLAVDLWYEEALQAIALIKYLGYQDVNIIGTSGGAQVAINIGLEAPHLVNKIIADSFEGETPLASFVEHVEEDREMSKEDEGTKQFYIAMHGDDWEQIIDHDTEAIKKHNEKIHRFFHKELNELSVPILFAGSLQDEFVCAVDAMYFQKSYGAMMKKVENSTMHLFAEGGHPAMLSNAEAFYEVSKQYFNQ